jgi:tripartite-type tricarboxylate transporter receptor subunit TctC
MFRRRLLLAAPGLALAAPRARAQAPTGAQPAWPSQPIRIVVPFAAGGATDILARALAQRLQAEWGQPVVAENRTGAGGTIGADAVAKAAADGHTLLLGTTATQSITGHLYPSLPYDPVRDFAPVAPIAAVPMLLVVHPSVPARDVAGLVALARARPGEVTFASSGQGAITHLASELFAARAGITLAHVPYRGSAPAMADLISGRVLMMIDHATTVLPQIRAGALRAVAAAGPKRMAELPEVPTIAETVPGVEVTSWFGVLAPAGTPAPVVGRLQAAIHTALDHADMQARLREQGAEAMLMDPDAFAALIARDSARWGDVVRSAGVKLG